MDTETNDLGHYEGVKNATDKKLMEMRRALNQSEMFGGRKASKDMKKMAKSSEQVNVGTSSE
jgi:hypothetical protein